MIENRLIQSVPNSGRNPLSLVLLAPGDCRIDRRRQSFISNGVRNNSSEVLMDGAALTSIEQNGGITDVKYTPTSDVVEEFKIQTNFFSAEFGNTGGTVINMVSKSGTNELHGVGYYYRRDAAHERQQLVLEFAQQSAGRFAPQLARRHDGRPGLPAENLQRQEPHLLLRRLRLLQAI